ncbi:MAG: PadR family transcriptional regulator [Brachybacterium sp.]|uniref:PadR family transcriptional regulator n=1 Tax=Brachybacterium sp. TaxID=1891286 RepID=UPI0026497B84|nr:PadR family transcriptional regulator [Brachybacterium sp.]MDN5688374.1 PadR family transcriptional regulator [Brachybacterium sp.]
MTNLDTHAEDAPFWPPTWVRALLPSAILACLEDGPLHGYAIARALGSRGFGVPQGGSLYPALARLEESGAIAAQWTPGPSGPARRQYTLTLRGHRQLTRDRSMLGALATALGTDPPDGRVVVDADSTTPTATVTATDGAAHDL